MNESKLLSAKYRRAINIASELFRDVTREITELPYIVHLIGVSHITAKITDDEDVHIAALLHDVLEDIPADKYDESNMRRDFGDRITDIVKAVSHDEVLFSKKEAREQYLEQISNGSTEACIVSAADLLYNATDIIAEFEKYPDKVKSIFGGERAERRQWFWGERYNILLSKLGSDHPIITELRLPLETLKAIHTQIR